MTDILLVRDTPSFQETAFRAYGLSFAAVCPSQTGSPYLPPAYLAILPPGFGDPEYSGLSDCFDPRRPGHKPPLVRFFRDFAKNGGTVLIFSPMRDAFDLSLLGFSEEGLTGFYRRKDQYLPADPSVLKDADVMFCDGFFEIAAPAQTPAAPAESVVLIKKSVGKGQVIMTTIHEMPSKEFFTSLISESGKSRSLPK